jgi:hypothetical protein
MDLETYRKNYEEGDFPGWEAIDTHLGKIYPKIEPDESWGTALPAFMTGKDFLEACVAYKNDSSDGLHYHFVSYGFSELFYNEDAVGQEYSKFGFELTFRLKPHNEDIKSQAWVFSLMQNLSNYVFESGNYFDDYHYIPTNSPIRLDTQTQLRALVFVTDSQLGEIETVHGKVKFLQMVGITQKEYDLIKEGKLDRFELVEKLKFNNPLLITDLERKSIV